MTVDTVRSNCSSAFDAGLPTIAYADAQNPDDASGDITAHAGRRPPRRDSNVIAITTVPRKCAI
jgi:hypothetical protein